MNHELNLWFSSEKFCTVCCLILMQISRAYKCELILRSRAIDQLRNERMVAEEEDVQNYFAETKDELMSSFPHSWKDKFKTCVDKYVEQCLEEARCPPEMAPKDEEEECICLHAIRRLVAGAFQEWELVQQHECACTCAWIDDALVWQGRGYVIQISFCHSLILTVHLEFILKSSADAMAGNANDSATYLHFFRALYTRYRYMQHHYTIVVSRKQNEPHLVARSLQ
jgi:hypothetical protein